jgi:hypothetical protein
LAELFGNTGALNQIGIERIESQRKTLEGLQEALGQARAAGYTDLVASLTSQIDDLNVTIIETINAQVRATIESINTATTRKLTRLDLVNRMADAIGAVGLDTAAGVGKTSLNRGQVFEQRGEALQQQRSSLRNVLLTTMMTPETSGNLQLIQDLTDQLAELDVTIAENTQAYFQARVQDVNERASTSLNILGLQQRIAELTGTITNTDTSAQVRALLEQRTVVLEQQNTGLQALLAEAQSKGDQKAINDLTAQMLENQIATLENTQAINQLTGTGNLQDFSSSAWQLFRRAIFDGLGNLLPQYAMVVPSAAMGASISQGGLIKVHSGEQIVPAEVARLGATAGAMGKNEFNTEVNITSPTEVADPVYIGNAIGWRLASNPNLRP